LPLRTLIIRGELALEQPGRGVDDEPLLGDRSEHRDARASAAALRSARA